MCGGQPKSKPARQETAGQKNQKGPKSSLSNWAEYLCRRLQFDKRDSLICQESLPLINRHAAQPHYFFIRQDWVRIKPDSGSP